MIYRHPDGSFDRYPYRGAMPASLTPIAGRPNWFIDETGKEVYVEPPRPTAGTPAQP